MHRKVRMVALALVVTVVCSGVAGAASSPSVQTGGHTNITQTSATLLGTINPNGSATSYVFQWGLTTSYGITGHVHSAGKRTNPITGKATPTGLTPGTVYHYRLFAINRYGTTFGTDRTFKTAGHPPPGASTGPATGVGPSGVTLTGVINPNGATTGWKFQYGLTPNYGSQTNFGSLASGQSPVVVAYPLAGLTPGTIFHYRLVAFHGNVATSNGTDAIFMTEPSPTPMPHVSANTTPRHARNKPFAFSTSGRVRGPAFIPAQFDCTGSVAIRFTLGKRTIAYELAPVQPDCTYSAQTAFARLPGHGAKHRTVGLKVAVRFHGNGYLQAVQARSERITLG